MKRKENKKIFFFMPLASVGGTESVHLDIVKALKDYKIQMFIRYSTNVWKGREYSNTKKAKLEGKAMVTEFEKYGSLTFLDKYLEAPRLGRFIRKLFNKRLSNRINRSVDPVVIFWHRESIDFIFDRLEPHVKIIDIVHNNSNNIEADAKYLLNDWVPRLNQRILVSNGLKKWIEPLYKEANYETKFSNRIKTIEHCVNFPNEGFIAKPTDIFNVLFIGRDSIEKQFHNVLQVAEKLNKLNSNFHFHFVGPQKENYNYFESENCTWYGTLTDRNTIEDIYKKAHVLIMTSSSEGFPKVISEAMAFSCVPIVTYVGDISSHIEANVNGILTQTENCINESILALLRFYDDKESFMLLSQNSYLYAREKFAEERFNNEWNNVIETLN